MLEEMGMSTGIDLELVMVATRMIQQFLNHPLASHVLRSGTRKTLFERAATGSSAQVR